MAESICIHTAQGLVCYHNQNVRYTKKLNADKEPVPVTPDSSTPQVTPSDHYLKKLKALDHVARSVQGFNPDDWEKIVRTLTP